MGPVERFVYVARHAMGSEVPLRRTLEHLPEDALAEVGVLEFASYVGSGYCVLQFSLPRGDAQDQFERFFNDPRVHHFLQDVAGFLEDGGQISKLYAAGDRFHAGADSADRGQTVSSGDLPLAAEASRWPKSV